MHVLGVDTVEFFLSLLFPAAYSRLWLGGRIFLGIWTSR